MSEKTWRDLDVSALRRLLATEVGPLTDARFAAIMDQMAADLDVRLPCRTCGAPMPVNAPDHVCRPEDRWLWRWGQGQVTDVARTTGFRAVQPALQRRYPLQAGHTRLYRGLCFPTDAAFGAFADDLGDDNRYVTQSVTSWTTDVDRARQFAIIPVGWRDAARRDQLIVQMMRVRANLAGAWGGVLSTTVTPDMVLCDLAGIVKRR